jgi:hypothetical protein
MKGFFGGCTRTNGKGEEDSTMRIGWIGGVERDEAKLERIAERNGHTLEFHSGHIGGRTQDGIRTLVERSDFVVIVTDVNSHGAVLLAKRLVGKVGRASLVIRRCGASRFQALLDAIALRDERSFAATG